jgi:hypothetical protein
LNQQFDYFDYPEIPNITLCNPNKEELYSLASAYNTVISPKFNALGEFTFTFPKSIDNGETELEAYDYLQNKRLVKVENYGYFMIVDSQEDLDGSTPIKNVTCQSLEVELINKKITAYGGTVKLYDIVSPEGTLLWYMIQLAPTWSIGNIDIGLQTKYRTFNVTDTNIYNFLMTTVEKSFECVFIFDTELKTISAKQTSTATIQTDIFLSFDNVIKKAKFSEKSDEIVTCLSVYGGGGLNIRTVNPLGTDKIYDFSYYANTNWMSSGLVTAITNWESVLSANQADYADNLLLLKTYNAELLDLQTGLTDLNTELLALEGVQKVRIQQGLPYSDINSQIIAKQAEITNQGILITNKQTQISSIENNLQAINTACSFDVNFNPAQLLELDSFIYENTYQNENIITTDSMTLEEEQDAAQDLYEQGQSVLARVSQPRYEIELESINYPMLPEFSVFTSQTEVGCTVTVELKDGSFIEVALLEISTSFYEPENFTLKFSNRLRMIGSDYVYSDLQGAITNTASAVAFDNYKWSNWENNYKDDVTTFITSALDTTTNNLISNSNQEILINQNGLRGRSYDSGTSSYLPKQVWLTNNVLAFSDDGFLTSKLALGEITVGTSSAYGLVAGVIVGNMIAGNTLTISNSNNNFLLNEQGAFLTNAKFEVSTTNTKITIDPTASNSFIIQKNEGGTFVNKFWVDNTGNVNFSGNLSGASGSFTGSISASSGSLGGWTIASNGIYDPYGNYIRSDGNIKLGGLSISGSSATFTGNIYADRLVGAVSYSQLTDIPAEKITSGTMSGSRIYGGTIGFPGVTMGTTANGASYIRAAGSISLETNAGGGISLSGTQVVQSSTFIGGSLQVTGNIYVSGGTGLSTSRTISTNLGNRLFTFSHGVLVSVT